MKHCICIAVMVTALGAGLARTAAGEMEIKQPPLDSEGRFYVYRNADALLPFIPCDWMPAEASKLMKMDIACTDAPLFGPSAKVAGKDTCISVTVKWAFPNWCGVAFVSGPDSPAWWGEDDRGWAYDLSSLKFRRLVFYGRSEHGASIQVKVGILGDKHFGDSLRFPVETRWLRLSKDWARFELDLSKCKPDQLRRICNGFTFVLSRDHQDGAEETTEFQLANIFFE